MIHNYLADDTSGNHWAVNGHASKPMVLVQLQDDGQQVRVALTPEQAEAMADKLRSLAVRARSLAPDRNTPIG